MPEGEEVHRRPADDLVGPQVDGEERVDEGEEAAGEHRAQQAEHPRAGLVRGQDPEEGSGQHHPLEADVDDAGALGEQAADGREDERRRKAEHRGEERRPDEDRVQVPDARLRRQRADPGSRNACGNRPPPQSPLPSRRRPDARGQRQDARRDRDQRAPRIDGRQGDPEGEEAERDSGRAHRARRSPRARLAPVEDAHAGLRRSLRRACQR